jgi:hypothetical protein
MTFQNDNIPLQRRLEPKLTPAQESRYEYNKWLLDHDIIDLRRFLENFGIDWRIVR